MAGARRWQVDRLEGREVFRVSMRAAVMRLRTALLRFLLDSKAGKQLLG